MGEKYPGVYVTEGGKGLGTEYEFTDDGQIVIRETNGGELGQATISWEELFEIASALAQVISDNLKGAK